jgi:hypothetical protein
MFVDDRRCGELRPQHMTGRASGHRGREAAPGTKGPQTRGVETVHSQRWELSASNAELWVLLVTAASVP